MKSNAKESIEQRRTYAAGQDGEDTLVEVHEGVVDSLDGVDSLVVVDSDQEVVTHLLGTLQELDVT